VGQHVQFGLAPGHKIAVEPDDPVTVIEGKHGHRRYASLYFGRPRENNCTLGACRQVDLPGPPYGENRPGPPGMSHFDRILLLSVE
jgi:hypothetical protein